MKKGRGTGLKGRRKLAAVLLGLLILSACKAGEDAFSRQKEIVDETARIVLLMDQDSRDYDLALQEIGRYLDEPDPEILAAVQQKVQESTAEFQTRQDQAESYEMTEDFADILVENHIDPEEYQMNADSRISSLGRFITRLQTMDTYLEMVSILPGTVEDDLRFMYEYNLEEQRIIRGYQYCAVNYWFASWEGEGAEYAKEHIADQLESFVLEESIWETSQEGAEQRMEVYLNQLEEQISELTDYIGEAQEELYEMEKENSP